MSVSSSTWTRASPTTRDCSRSAHQERRGADDSSLVAPALALKMAALPKRIIKETERLVSDPPPGISAHPHDESNLRYFDVAIAGPEGSPYEGGLFKLEARRGLSERSD